MDRTIVYPGSIPLDTDLLRLNRNTMVALGALMKMALGTSTVVDGLTVAPTVPSSMSVTVGAGSVTALTVVDNEAFGSLPANGDGLVKMGVNLEPTMLTLAAPTISGQSVAWLIEAAFVEADANPLVLPYYNASNPMQPWMGPGNSGTTQPTTRVQQVQLQARSGVAAASGSQVPPVVDAGWVGLAVVTLTFGQTTVEVNNISPCAAAPLLPYRLPQLRPGFASLQAFTASGTFVVPSGVTTAKVTVIGGGGAGGSNANAPGGGGGAGGRAIGVVSGLVPGGSIYVTVGAGGTATSVPGLGGPGETSSFGTYLSATGGSGGGGGTSNQQGAGGPGGIGVGGQINETGAYGTDSVLPAGRGGDGGGPGGGRGTTGLPAGIAANGPGGGGGGGGSQPGGEVGAPGGNGAPGLVFIEY